MTASSTIPAITKDMTIREVITFVPVAADIMLEYGLHCFSSSVGGVETLEQGCQMHGIDAETIEALVDDILFCDGNECIYSFHAEQYPDIACELIQDYRFEAEVFDWQDNSTGAFDLLILDGAPE